MRCSLAIAVVLSAASGCVMHDPVPMWPGSLGMVVYDNPALVPVADHELVWETVVDVIDDDFQVDREVPVRQYGDVLTEGRLDTFPLVGSTILEPWLDDAVNVHEKIEGTLQSIRRQAVVRVIPAQGGHWIEVVVLKELEDTAQPLMASAGPRGRPHQRDRGPLGLDPAGSRCGPGAADPRPNPRPALRRRGPETEVGFRVQGSGFRCRRSPPSPEP